MAKITNLNSYSDDDLLWHGLRRGDSSAFPTIYEKYHKMIYGLSLRYLRNTAMAEDCVQHVFVRLWERRLDLEFPSTSKITSTRWAQPRPECD